jgi:diguanylate cyclase (GGDEF)-like protein
MTLANDSNGFMALLFIDLDKFKDINDRLGHDVGDQLLQEAAQRIQQTMRNTDTVARMGGDEFTAILSPITDPQYAENIADQLIQHLSQPFTIAGQQLTISASIGIAIYPQDGIEPATLLRQADIAMYRAKENGRNCWCYAQPEHCSR